MIFSLSIVVSFLASSASALITPHGLHARDAPLAARHHHHHHVARQANIHTVARRSARRERCLERSAFPSSTSSSSPYSPAPVTTTTSSNAVLDVPVNVAPAPVTYTTPPAPAPAEPTTTTPPDPPPHQAPTTPNQGGGETHSGDGTYFDVGLGACGQTSANSDHIVAIGWELFDSFAIVANPNLNPVCGRQIRATFGGKSVTVVVLDRCGGCKPYDLDFSPSAFSQIADQSLGRLPNVEWQFI